MQQSSIILKQSESHNVFQPNNKLLMREQIWKRGNIERGYFGGHVKLA